MSHPLAGHPAPHDVLTDIAALLAAYFEKPDPSQPGHRVAFGTSGHRGCALLHSFNEAHIHAIAQAIVEYRQQAGITGPLFLGMDTHALSAPAQRSVLEVLAAHRVTVHFQQNGGYTPTPVISRAILAHNAPPAQVQADGIIITPSHNPPRDGGIKYNPPHGGPADTQITAWIERRANELLATGNRDVKHISYTEALAAPTTIATDLMIPYIACLDQVIDMAAIARSGLRIGVDPMGGAAVDYWRAIAQHYGISITVTNPNVDPTFGFMTLDHDGKIRMDCSSPYAMASLVALKEGFDIAWGNDADVDRHGIVTPSTGLMNPNHYLAVAIDYLLAHRPNWPRAASVGKTVVSSGLIDRVVAHHGRRLFEVPVGFKWFSDGLLQGTVCFGGEESAGASFLSKDGSAWSTDKDGILLGLLAAEITAVTGKDPGQHYLTLAAQFGTPYYQRIDAPATPQEKTAFKRLTPENIQAQTLAGEAITERLTRAAGNQADIGGLKVSTANGWFAARPSGTEDIYKIYAESFMSEAHLQQLVTEAKAIVSTALST